MPPTDPQRRAALIDALLEVTEVKKIYSYGNLIVTATMPDRVSNHGELLSWLDDLQRRLAQVLSIFN